MTAQKNRSYFFYHIIIFVIFVEFIFLTCLISKNAHAQNTNLLKKNFVQLDLSLTENDFPIKLPIYFEQEENLLVENLSDLEQDPRFSLCMKENKDYLSAMNLIEQSIADVAVKDRKIQGVMDKFTKRLFQLINYYASLEIAKGPPNTSLEKKIDEILGHYYADNADKVYRDPRLGCDQYFGGCVGSDPKVIRQVFLNGNLRERHKVLWRDTFFLLEDITPHLCQHLQNSVQETSSSASTLTPALSLSFKNNLKEYCNKDYFLNRGKFSTYAKSYKKDREYNKRTAFISALAPKKSEMRIPLSERESHFLDLHPQISYFDIGRGNSDDRVYYSMGMGVSEMVADHLIKDPQDPDKIYLRTARNLGFPMAVSPSGTTDQLLTMAQIFGITDVEELKALRVSMMGFFIDGHHHSAYEVITASQSFPQIPMRFGPEYYKDLYPSYPEFAQEVETAYFKKRNDKKLPAQLLVDCWRKNSHQEQGQGQESDFDPDHSYDQDHDQIYCSE